MAETNSLEDLKKVMEGGGAAPAAGGEAVAVDPATLPEPKIDELGRAYATGKRKTLLPAFGLNPATAKSPLMAATKKFTSPVPSCA